MKKFIVMVILGGIFVASAIKFNHSIIESQINSIRAYLMYTGRFEDVIIQFDDKTLTPSIPSTLYISVELLENQSMLSDLELTSMYNVIQGEIFSRNYAINFSYIFD